MSTKLAMLLQLFRSQEIQVLHCSCVRDLLRVEFVKDRRFCFLVLSLVLGVVDKPGSGTTYNQRRDLEGSPNLEVR